MRVKIWRGERVKERWLRAGAHLYWLVALPYLVFAVTSWSMDSHSRVALVAFGFMALIAAALGGVVTALAMAHLVAVRRYGPSEVEVDDDGLRIGGDRIAAAELATAWAIEPEEIEILLRDGDEITLGLQSPEEARAFGQALRARIDRSRSWPLANGNHTLGTLGALLGTLAPLGIASLFAGASPWFLFGMPIAITLAWRATRPSPRVRFGADGFTVGTRYVAYRDVASVEERSLLRRTLFVRLTSGERVKVLAGLGSLRASLLRSLIEEGVAMVGRGEDAGAALNDLERGDADDEQLLARLVRVASQGRYRSAAIDPERLERLIRNPAAPSAQRIAAAIALRHTPGGCAQIRVAAEVTDEPEVREAFDTLAAEELDEHAEKALLKRVAG